MIRQAVILSAGLGTRLRPLTNSVPKVMLPILGKPLLEHNLLQFKKHGVEEFFINLHHLPDVIRNCFGNGSKWEVKIQYNFEPALLGTAGGMKQFEKYLGDSFFLIYGDIFSLCDYSKYLNYFVTKPDAIGMQTICTSEYAKDVDLVKMSDNKRFLEIYPKPHADLPSRAFTMKGIFIFTKKILSYIPEGIYYEIGKDLLPDIIQRGERFYGYESPDYSRGIDTIEKLRAVEAYLLEHPVKR